MRWLIVVLLCGVAVLSTAHSAGRKQIPLDLQPQANQKLIEGFGRGPGAEANNLAALPTEEQKAFPGEGQS